MKDYFGSKKILFTDFKRLAITNLKIIIII